MKEKVNKKHTQVPNGMSDKELTMKDQLIYLVIKSHDNPQSGCFPSLKTIAFESGISIPTVRKSIERLEKAKYITVTKVGRKQYYKFSKYKKFEPFSDEFIKRKDITPTTKAFIVATQQCMFKDVEGLGKMSLTNEAVSKIINMSEDTVRRCNNELELKGFMTTVKNNNRDLESGCKTDTKLYNLQKLGQMIVWKLKEHEDRINKNTEDIEKLNKKLEDQQNTIAKQQKLIEALMRKEKKTFIID